MAVPRGDVDSSHVRTAALPYSSGMVSSSQPPRRGRLTLRGMVLVLGVVLVLLAAPALFVVWVTTETDRALLAGLVCGVAGLVLVGQVLVPQRRGGTKIWQNDGLPGGV
jgi:hypothetical protein